MALLLPENTFDSTQVGQRRCIQFFGCGSAAVRERQGIDGGASDYPSLARLAVEGVVTQVAHAAVAVGG
jgi:hypothetical protein